MNIGERVARFWVYALPLPLCGAMYFAWLNLFGSHAFALYVSLLPVIYGYIAPGVATNILKLWRFKGAWVVGSYYAHHGFMYCANMSPLLFVAFLGTDVKTVSFGLAVRVLLTTAAMQGFLLWILDILIVRYGMVEIDNRPTREGKSPEEIVTYYAPLCFSLIGLTYSAGALIAFQYFVVNSDLSSGAILQVCGYGAALIFTLPGFAYHCLERR